MKIGERLNGLFRLCILKTIGIETIPYENSYILGWMVFLLFNLFFFMRIYSGKHGWNYLWLGMSFLGIIGLIWIGKKYGKSKTEIKKKPNQIKRGRGVRRVNGNNKKRKRISKK